MKYFFRTLFFSLLAIVTFVKCSSKDKDESWEKVIRVKKKVNNLTYYFPSTVSILDRLIAIEKCEVSIQENLELIHEKEFIREMDIEFLNTREEMLKYTGMAAQGMAFPDRNTFFTLQKDKNSPIKHEMMHMITMCKWGFPDETSKWMNEGLATYSGGTCSDYTLEEIYTYYIQSAKLVSINNLANDFYGIPDMISYTESAYLVKFLIDNYGLEKFIQLWKSGYDELSTIYGFTSEDLQKEIKTIIEQKYPKSISFDWETFDKGCN